MGRLSKILILCGAFVVLLFNSETKASPPRSHSLMSVAILPSFSQSIAVEYAGYSLQAIAVADHTVPNHAIVIKGFGNYWPGYRRWL
jgi:hypothetical protein